MKKVVLIITAVESLPANDKLLC